MESCSLDGGLERYMGDWIGAVGTATFLLTWFDTDLPAIDLLFEAASAFGTVGMSTGLTPELSAPSRVLIIVLMFVGRVGPITFVGWSTPAPSA